MTTDPILLVTGWIAAGVICLALALAAIRLAKGPSVPDRVAALDLVAMLILALLGATSLLYEEAVFLDVALVLGLVSFVGTVAFARYLERRARP